MERNFLCWVNKEDWFEGDLRLVNEDNDGWFFGLKLVFVGLIYMDIWEGSVVEFVV